eukprot:10814582-Prorocentrum_lima.AAC.1
MARHTGCARQGQARHKRVPPASSCAWATRNSPASSCAWAPGQWWSSLQFLQELLDAVLSQMATTFDE